MRIQRSDGLNDSNACINLPCNIFKNTIEIADTVVINGELITSLPDSNEMLVYDEDSLNLINKYNNIKQIIYAGKEEVLLVADKYYSYYLGKGKINKTNLPFLDDFLFINKNQEYDWFTSMLFENMDTKKEKSYIVRVNKESFKQQWKLLVAQFSISKTVTNNQCTFFFDENDDVYCVSSESGSTIWEKKFDSFGFLKLCGLQNFWPALYKDNLVAIFRCCTVGLDVNTGEVSWIFDKAMGYGLITIEGEIYQLGYINNQLALFIVSAETGDILSNDKLTIDNTEFLEKLTHVNPLSWANSRDHVWVGWGDGYLIAINKKTRHIDWHTQLEGTVSKNMFVANNRLYCHTRTPNINIPNNSYVIEGMGGYIPDELLTQIAVGFP